MNYIPLVTTDDKEITISKKHIVAVLKDDIEGTKIYISTGLIYTVKDNYRTVRDLITN